MADDKSEILVASTSAIYKTASGVQVRIRKGRTTALRGHPFVRGFEQFWTPFVPTFNETNIGRRRGKAAKV
jgi:hypothetical protein